MIEVVHVVGTRPNLVKVASVIAAMGRRAEIHQTLIDTGQHYDPRLSSLFYEDLRIPHPDLNLQIGVGKIVTPNMQVAKIIMALDEVFMQVRPDIVFVYGDVNSALAASLVCAKMFIPLAHVEAGMRSRDRTMPEEVNRILIDHIADLLFAINDDARHNLLDEGISDERIKVVGSVAIDTLREFLSKPLPPNQYASVPYGLITLHRPSNVDDPIRLRAILETLTDLSRQIPLIFPIHPRTAERVRSLAIAEHKELKIIEPCRYPEFIRLLKEAQFVITDSGGVEAEARYLSKPCIILRETSEASANGILVGINDLAGKAAEILRQPREQQLISTLPGNASDRICECLAAWIQTTKRRTS